MIIVENLGLGPSLNSSLLVTRRDILVIELKNIFLKHYEDVGNDQLVKNEDKHMEMEKRWFSSLGLICKVLSNNLVASLSQVEDTLLSILRNCSGTQSLSDIVAVFHAIAHSTFDILMKKGLEEETSSNTISDLNNNNPGFIDGDQNLRLISLAGGCMGQMMNNYKDVWNKNTKSNTQFVNFITSITMCKEEKSNLEEALKDRDRGGLFFPRRELNRFLVTFERELDKVANKETMKSYGANAIKVICCHMKNATCLQEEFEQAVNNMELADCRLFELEDREPFFKIFVRKLVHARVGAFISSYNQLKVDARKGLSKGGSMLRDDLYGFAKNQKKKKAETRKKEQKISNNCDKRKTMKLKAISCDTEDPLPSCNSTEDPVPSSSNQDLHKVDELRSGTNIKHKATNYLTAKPLPLSASPKLFMEAECDTQPSCSGMKTTPKATNYTNEKPSPLSTSHKLFTEAECDKKP